MRFTAHTQVFNYLIERFNYKSYLEIGVNNPTGNFDLVKCKFKIGVDPNPMSHASFTGTSDEFFEQRFNKLTFDIIFIDGLHHADQVKKDFENSLACLNTGGIILLHDTTPEDERFTVVPRNGLRGRWNGDVFRILPCLSDFDYRTLSFDANGLTVVKPGGTLKDLPQLSYQEFNTQRKELARPCTDEQFEEWI